MENESDKKNEENTNDKSKTTPQKVDTEQNKENKIRNGQKISTFHISSSNKSQNNANTEPQKQTNNLQISSSSNTPNVQPFSISSSSQRPKQNFQISSSHQGNNISSTRKIFFVFFTYVKKK